jgi:zinc protease
MLGVAGCQPRPSVLLPPVADSSTAIYEVSNLKVIHRFSAASDVVAVRLYLLGGTRQLTEENAGIEVLLLRAAELESGNTIARTGSHQILEASPDWTVTGFVGLREDLDSTWSGLARQLGRPTFSEASLERARGELVTVARRRYTEPDLRVRATAQRAAFQGHPYALDPEGTVESLTSLSRTDLERYWEEQFVTSRMLLVVVGAITRAKIDSLVTTMLGPLPAGEYEWTLPPAVPRRPMSWRVKHQELPTNYILGYFDGPSPTDSAYFPFRVAVALLSSFLEERLRGQQSLSYAAYALFLDRARPIGGIYTSTSSPGEAIDIIRRALSEVKELVGRDPRGWDRFLDQFALGELLQRMTNAGQAEALARAYLYFDDLEMADEFVPRLRRVSISEVGKVALWYMQDIQYGYMGDTAQMRGKW